MKKFLAFLTCLISLPLSAQFYQSWRVGSQSDTATFPTGGTCLFGGGTDNITAMKWFLEQANGGDILVLRLNGTDSYNNYLFNQVGIPVHSVETILFTDSLASFEPSIIAKIDQAEGILMIGGDTWSHIKWWRNTPVDSAIRVAAEVKKTVVGGTGKAMALMGSHYFTERFGPLSGEESLADPYHINMKLSSDTFLLTNPYLEATFTEYMADSITQQRRLVAFMAHIYDEFGQRTRGIACDLTTAVCVNNNGMARIYGNGLVSNDKVYFIQPNCELSDNTPEICNPMVPLQWDHAQQALKVYVFKAGLTPNQTFDLSSWLSGTEGSWETWWVQGGALAKALSQQPDCQPDTSSNGILESVLDDFSVYPNPVTTDHLVLPTHSFDAISVYDAAGKLYSLPMEGDILRLNGLQNGMYLIVIERNGQQSIVRWILQR